jgi:hypothetical protein
MELTGQAPALVVSSGQQSIREVVYLVVAAA